MEERTQMATKAEAYRRAQQRSAKPPQPKQPPRRRREKPVDTARAGVSATDRRAGGDATAARNRSARAQTKGGARLESSASGKPSRKSTRKSVGRVKRTANLQRREIRRTSSPQARAEKAAAGGK
jgi:hypothetical protein